jgi:hypothetical protein
LFALVLGPQGDLLLDPLDGGAVALEQLDEAQSLAYLLAERGIAPVVEVVEIDDDISMTLVRDDRELIVLLALLQAEVRLIRSRAAAAAIVN